MAITDAKKIDYLWKKTQELEELEEYVPTWLDREES